MNINIGLPIDPESQFNSKFYIEGWSAIGLPGENIKEYRTFDENGIFEKNKELVIIGLLEYNI